MPPPHSCWPAPFLTRWEVGCLRRLASPASLVDWRCSCSCFGLIPSVTERSTLFVKELSFPQTAPTDDAFFNWNWAEGCWNRWAGLLAPDGGLLFKNKKERGSARASLVAAPMPKSVPP